ncbi:DUF4258 domain-containing protein [Spongiimicrobium salis]|uniref:DUF4258 domain-containing protein n=1 Tax=Spongiimicrobium salis TaxID=1667022 RepID=UPI00374D9D22
MPFTKRLFFFLFGLALGILFMVFFIRNKAKETGTEFCYLPNCRVLKDLRSKPLYYNASVQELLENKSLDSTDIHSFFRDGDVDFSASDTKSKPCKTYVIEGTAQGSEAVLTVTNCPKKVTVERVQF